MFRFICFPGQMYLQKKRRGSFDPTTPERDMIVSADDDLQHSIHKCLRSVEPVAVAETPLRCRTLHDGDLFVPFLRLGQNKADGLTRVAPQIMTSRPQSTELDVAQIAYVKASPRRTVDHEEPHWRLHSKEPTEALELRKS